LAGGEKIEVPRPDHVMISADWLMSPSYQSTPHNYQSSIRLAVPMQHPASQICIVAAGGPEALTSTQRPQQLYNSLNKSKSFDQSSGKDVAQVVVLVKDQIFCLTSLAFPFQLPFS
jgi:hypothetical protein